MKQIVVDTNAFLRLFLDDVPQQVKEVEVLLKKARSAQITAYVPQIVIFELNFILDKYYNFKKVEIIDKLKSVIQSPYLHVQDRTILQEALKIYEKNTVSLADSFVLSFAQEKGAEVFTFDKNLQKLITQN